MKSAEAPRSPVEETVEPKPAAKNRAWMWMIIWIGIFLIAPGYLVGLLRQQRSREFATSLVRVQDAHTQAAPGWMPLRGDFRIEQSYVGESSGNAIFHTGEPIDAMVSWFEQQFRSAGFTVSTNSMQHDNATATVIFNASQSEQGEFVLLTLSRSSMGTRIELAYTETR